MHWIAGIQVSLDLKLDNGGYMVLGRGAMKTSNNRTSDGVVLIGTIVQTGSSVTL
jgi:hypothetical protein